MATLPEGTLTFVLTDVEGSTKTWEERPEAMRGLMLRHDALVSAAVMGRGDLVEAGREGDSVLAVFKTAADAAACALELQRLFTSEPWPAGLALKIRVALHTGEADLRDGHYFGPALNRCARLLSTCNPGQILLTRATQELLADQLHPPAQLRDLGLHRLKDLMRPEHVFQLTDGQHPASFPPIRSLPNRLHNLPVQLTTFVGRGRELTELRELQARTRLLTLVGPGGVGKTRLALQLAADVFSGFADGVWLVELAPVADAGLVPNAVANALDIPEQRDRPLPETLARHFGERQALLVLDNCEHVLDAAGGLSERLLKSCSQLRILATSREPLGIPGEVTWWAPPLDAGEAVLLFNDRAAAVEPGFRADGSAVVADICRSLDGLPLAIELAAARVHMMPVAEINARLGDRFRLLTGGSRSAAERQRTLEAAVDWSYDQLPENEGRLFRRLAVFSGWFSLGDSESVCAAPGLDSNDMLELLTRLVAKSLVAVDGARYRWLETIRAYALRRLAQSGEEATSRRRHAVYFLAKAEARRPGGLATWLDSLEDQHDNLRGALGLALDVDPELGLRLTAAIHDFWQLRGHNTEGRRWLEALLAVAPAASALTRRALVDLATFAYIQDELDTAERILSDAHEQAKAAGDDACELLALKISALVELARGRAAEAEGTIRSAVELARRLGDAAQEGHMMHHLGLIRASGGELAGALDILEESIAVRRRVGRGDECSTTLAFMAGIANLQGDTERADLAITESLRIGSQLKDRRLAWALDIVAVRLAQSRPESAIRLAGAASEIHASIGSRPTGIWKAQMEVLLRPAVDGLGEEACSRLSEEGRRMSFEEAVDRALAEMGAPVQEQAPAG
jgi:predicted ATPase/class 3 adenylate cyclase